MRLSNNNRLRIVQIYSMHKLKFSKNKFEIIKNLALEEGIQISVLSVRNLIKKWLETGKILFLLKLKLINCKIETK